MADAIEVNYPDVLGHITGGTAASFEHVRAAIALNPRVARAGHPIEIILLVQNMVDAPLDITVNIQLPDRDAARNKGRFLAKAQRIAFDLDPAAVGCMILPVSTLPDTAPGADYPVAVDLKVQTKQRGRPNAVRDVAAEVDGVAQLRLDRLTPERRARYEELRRLTWSVESKGRSLQASFAVLGGRTGKIVELKPRWETLWTVADHHDDRALLMQYGEQVERYILRGIHKERAFHILQDYTRKKFENEKYPLLEIEERLISKLMASVLMYARANPTEAQSMRAMHWNVRHYFKPGYLEDGFNAVELPRWLRRLLELVGKEPRLAQAPVRAVAHYAYDALLADAMHHAFDLIETRTATDVGTPEERDQYIQHVLDSLSDGELDFEMLYMPLVLGGIIVNSRLLVEREDVTTLVGPLRDMLEARYPERSSENRATFEMANRFVEQAMDYHKMQ